MATLDSAPPRPSSKSRAKRSGPVRRAANSAMVSPKVTSSVISGNYPSFRGRGRRSGRGGAVEDGDLVLVAGGEEVQQPAALLGHGLQVGDRLPLVDGQRGGALG